MPTETDPATPEEVVSRDERPGRDPLARLYAVGIQCTVTSLSFFLTAVVKVPVPLYFPLSRRWSLVPSAEELSMDFFGRSLVALGAGLLAAALTLAVFRVRARWTGRADSRSAAAPGSGLPLLTVYAATALILAMGVFGYELYGRVPLPEPLPSVLPGPLRTFPSPAP